MASKKHMEVTCETDSAVLLPQSSRNNPVFLGVYFFLSNYDNINLWPAKIIIPDLSKVTTHHKVGCNKAATVLCFLCTCKILMCLVFN